MARMGFLDKAREVEVGRPCKKIDIGDRGKELHSTKTDEEWPSTTSFVCGHIVRDTELCRVPEGSDLDLDYNARLF